MLAVRALCRPGRGRLGILHPGRGGSRASRGRGLRVPSAGAGRTCGAPAARQLLRRLAARAPVDTTAAGGDCAAHCRPSRGASGTPTFSVAQRGRASVEPRPGQRPARRLSHLGAPWSSITPGDPTHDAGESVLVQSDDSAEQIANLALFSTVPIGFYWSGTEYAPNSIYSWGFGDAKGDQGIVSRTIALYAIRPAVREKPRSRPSVAVPRRARGRRQRARRFARHWRIAHAGRRGGCRVDHCSDPLCRPVRTGLPRSQGLEICPHTTGDARGCGGGRHRCWARSACACDGQRSVGQRPALGRRAGHRALRSGQSGDAAPLIPSLGMRVASPPREGDGACQRESSAGSLDRR
jgi:hypothetical protein